MNFEIVQSTQGGSKRKSAHGGREREKRGAERRVGKTRHKVGQDRGQDSISSWIKLRGK